MRIGIGDYGDVEAEATAYTLVLYEQEFGGADLIADVFGRHEANGSDGGTVTVDFTSDNWTAELRALWAMVRTAYDIRFDRGDAAPNDRPKPFDEWVKGVGRCNMRDISAAIVSECIDGFFRPRGDSSEKETVSGAL